MIPAIIFYILKKIKDRRKSRLSRLNTSVSAKLLVLALSLTSLQVFGQQDVHRYSILYKGDKVGFMQITQNKTGDSIHYKTISDVKMSMIFSIHVATTEESMFVRDRLMSSAVVRNVNGNDRVNRQLTAVNDYYMLNNQGKKKASAADAINFNLTRLYLSEPVNKTKVWSDAYHEYLKIQQVSPHKYKVTLPDGDFNYYYFNNGICNKVEIVHSFYTIQMVLN